MSRPVALEAEVADRCPVMLHRSKLAPLLRGPYPRSHLCLRAGATTTICPPGSLKNEGLLSRHDWNTIIGCRQLGTNPSTCTAGFIARSGGDTQLCYGTFRHRQLASTPSIRSRGKQGLAMTGKESRVQQWPFTLRLFSTANPPHWEMSSTKVACLQAQCSPVLTCMGGDDKKSFCASEWHPKTVQFVPRPFDTEASQGSQLRKTH